MDMLYFLEIINVAASILMITTLIVIVRQQPSKAQIAFLLYNIFTFLFVVGIQLELMNSDTIAEALSGLCVQYIGQAGLLIALLWFISEFVHLKISKWVYRIQAVIEGITVIGVFTAEYHPYFYTSMYILTDGYYNRIKVTDGIIWYIHYLHLYLVIFIVLFLLIKKYRHETRIQRKRILYIIVGISTIAFELFLKIIGVFGSYNPMVISMTFSTICMMAALVRYGYFGTLHAAVDNAFNHGEEGLIVLDSENTIIFLNQKIGMLFSGLQVGDSITKQKEIMDALKSPRHMLYWGKTIYELRTEDIIENGEKNGYMFWFIDQTEHLKTMEQLRKADEIRTQFLMKVSHELRTPMNTMLSMNEMIQRETTDETIKGYAKEVAYAGENMLSLIEEVLEVSRIEKGSIELKKRPYKLKDIIKKVEALICPQAEKKGLFFQIKLEGVEEGLLLYGDDGRILQIIINLLSNAVKYTEKGRIGLKVAANQEKGKKRLLFSVSDTGIGIAEQEQVRIFENFERGSNAKNSNIDGMGLGLAIVKQLAKEVEGEVTLDSTINKGSTFILAVPWEEAFEKIQVEEKEQNIPDFSGKIILVVDDNKNNLMVLAHLLRRTHIQIETAIGGAQAIEACKNKTYDLILLDHMMPYPNGIETLHLLRESEEGRNHYTKAVALTANVTKGAGELYRKEGFAGYISKPIQPKRLEEVLLQQLYEEKGPYIDKGEFSQRFLFFLEKNGISAKEGLKYADEDIEFYWNLLQLFVKEKNKNEEKLRDTLGHIQKNIDDNAWEPLISNSHKWKGEAKGIGAKKLGELFYQLELAGKAKDKKKVEIVYKDLLEEWQHIVEIIKLGTKRVTAKEEL